LSVPAAAAKHLEEAQKHFNKMDVRRALTQIDQALQIDPHCAAAFSMRSFVRLAANEVRGAIADALQAAALDSHDSESYVALATAYNYAGDFQKAAKAAGQALSIRPDDWHAGLELAKSLYGQGQYVMALGALDAVSMDFPDVHLVRADVLMRLGHSQEAADQFIVFLKQEPNDPRGEQIRRILDAAQPSPIDSNPQPRIRNKDSF
jgi:tetratricopeptide (TPR) repeat protein